MKDDRQGEEDLQDFPVSALYRGIQDPRSSERNKATDLDLARKGLRILGYVYREKFPEEEAKQRGAYHDYVSGRARATLPVSYNRGNRRGRWVGGIPVQIDRVNRKENK
jgi:ribosome modulation factor